MLKTHQRLQLIARRSSLTVFLASVIAMSNVGVVDTTEAATVGSGFVVTAADLSFILKQIKIAERHARAFQKDSATVYAGGIAAAPQPNPHPDADPSYCLSMIGSGTDRIPDALTSYGLRTTDGSCNNLFNTLNLTNANNDHPTPTFTNHPTIGAADLPFPRMTDPVFKDAEASPLDFFGPGSGTISSNGGYTQKLANNVVFDSQPRLISNLIVDQTSSNPAAIAAAGFPVRAFDGSPVHPCDLDSNGNDIPNSPSNCVPKFGTLFIENVTTDIGLSPPYNSMFTFFGQFFDHGVDQTVKSGGKVFVPLRDDDPLIAGPDHVRGDVSPTNDPPVKCTVRNVPVGCNEALDDLPASQRFIPLSRGQNQPGPDGQLGTADDVQDANNTDTPWVDQSQTYTSHSAHQFFLREYVSDGAGHPLSTGKFLGGLPAGQTYLNSPDSTTGISTWASTKKQAHELLGLRLVDTDVTNIPMINTDPYGNYIPGPLRGLPQYVTTVPVDAAHPTGIEMVEGRLDDPNTATDETIPVPTNVEHFDTPFLTDIAHNADPSEQDLDHDGIPETFPTPDADNTPSANFADQPAGTYDNEILDAHFTCGDGRCNENIALTAVHQIFHSEHDRLAKEFDTSTLPNNPSLLGLPNVTLKDDYQATNCPIGCATNNPNLPITFTYGQRLFQAARFVTEMEYQHLVFEEFGRKVQPLIRPFHVYTPTINPATKAEFAHAVYRFGHSMLDDDVARTEVCVGGIPAPACKNPDGTNKPNNTKIDNSVSLLKAFLNPPEYFNNVSGGFYTPEEAAGAIVMGSADQPGNELDEFINDTLRNQLLGLPLDLASFNLTRARSEGVPSLNEFRRQINGQTTDSALTPYTSWSNFGQHLKHPESLINFVAAYGKHPTILTESTIVGKRTAARRIVDPTFDELQFVPCDAADFIFGTNGDNLVSCPNGGGQDWSDAGGLPTTGLEDVDLWVGGLAEVTNPFGGLLGDTFNHVFQTQMELLQDGDRFYYLARTPGLNLRTQLEGNSFSELVMRNTQKASTLKADPFATADCKFQVANLTFPATLPNPDGIPNSGDENKLFGAGTVNNDPTTECDENALLVRDPTNGRYTYRNKNSVDPSGINGQSVYNGTIGNDILTGGNDNDTFWGDLGNDIIEGGAGDDIALGGEGNDIITDSSGADILKGGPGNDALDGGIGDDILLSNEGKDFDNGGKNDNETFAGPGDDFVIAGEGADAVFGDDEDDWIEGGTGQDLLIGDHGAPFFDDPGQSTPGNDIFVGQDGENDYDAEGGDDLMAQNAFVDRNAGAGGFDWAFHQYNTVAANDDLEINKVLVGQPIQIVVNRDRWQEVEADSGDKFNDIILGTTDALPLGGAGFSGCDALDNAGINRITGLRALVNTFPTSLASVVAGSVSGVCPLTGSAPNNAAGTGVWAEGNILLGGGGSDSIEGRGNNDIIDGDHTLHVRISVRSGVDANGLATGSEIASTDLMENIPTGSGWTAAPLAGKTLQKAVFAGLIDPGRLVATREIVSQDGTRMGAFDGTANTNRASDCLAPLASQQNCDVAVFSGPAPTGNAATDEYTITLNANGSVTVTDLADPALAAPIVPPVPRATDGIDTLWNIEQLKFCAVQGAAKGTCATYAAPISIVPVAVASTAALAFGNQNVGTTSAAKTITVSNAGLRNLNLNGVAITGASFQLAAGTTCTGTTVLTAGSSCLINVQFASTAPTGSKTGNVAISSNAEGLPLNVTLSGTATVPAANVAPTSLVFGNQTVGITSAAQTVTLNSTGDGELTIGNIITSGAGFARAGGTCPTGFPAILAAAPASCTITVTFTPTAVGASSGSVVVADDAGGISGTTQTTTLSGTGVAAPAAPTNVAAVRGAASGAVNLTWTPPTGPITSFTVQVRAVVLGVPILTSTINGIPGNATGTTVTGLTGGVTYNFNVRAVNGVGAGPFATSNNVVAFTVPSTLAAPTVAQGAAGGALTATVNWNAPLLTGGTPVTGYIVTALQMSSAAAGATVVNTTVSGLLPVTPRTFTFTSTAPALTNFRFTVQAVNLVGSGTASARSAAVMPQ
jgi:Ca2+-binding RTX toxin-like protein